MGEVSRSDRGVPSPAEAPCPTDGVCSQADKVSIVNVLARYGHRALHSLITLYGGRVKTIPYGILLSYSDSGRQDVSAAFRREGQDPPLL